ncbi:MAG: helix-turn-helix domain-containing protein [bacterium]|nr:helix-turn-helix domain-containing protein [bacterium]
MTTKNSSLGSSLRVRTADLQRTLVDLGLADREAALYLALLAAGPTSMAGIASASGSRRTTLYPRMQRLVKKGIVRVEVFGRRRRYAAITPEELYALHRARLERVRELLPRLGAIVAAKHPGTRVHAFEGREQVIAVYDDFLRERRSGPVLAFVALRETQRALPDFMATFINRRMRRKVRMRAIMPDTPDAQDRKRHDEEELRETRLIPADRWVFSGDVYVYGDRVAIVSAPDLRAVRIESTEIARTMRAFFELAWIGAMQT